MAQMESWRNHETSLRTYMLPQNSIHLLNACGTTRVWGFEAACQNQLLTDRAA